MSVKGRDNSYQNHKCGLICIHTHTHTHSIAQHNTTYNNLPPKVLRDNVNIRHKAKQNFSILCTVKAPPNQKQMILY